MDKNIKDKYELERTRICNLLIEIAERHKIQIAELKKRRESNGSAA